MQYVDEIEDAQQEADSKKNRITRIGRGARFLCPICGDTDNLSLGRQEAEEETITLACGHRREPALPQRVGTIGIEQLNTALGMALFPYMPFGRAVEIKRKEK